MIRQQPRPTLFPYTTLFRSAGIRTDPAVSVPSAAVTMPAASAAAEPLEDPPVTRSGSHGLRHGPWRSEEHTSELQSHVNLVCRLLLEKKKKTLLCRFLKMIH